MIGGSTGSIEALGHLLGSLPADLPAAIFVVVHTTAQGPGLLPKVLSRAGTMPAIHPQDGERLRPGQIYVAPPDHHLLLGRSDIIHVRRGPRENGARPAIDPLFRTAASAGYGPRMIAVVLSGYLDDGAAGLYAVRKRGGVAIVQDPNDALAGDMPVHALEYAGADYILEAGQIGTKLAELVSEPGKVVTMKKKRGARPASRDEAEAPPNAFAAHSDEGDGNPSVFACPECHGVLWEIKEGGSVRYRCRTGHGYSETTLDEELSKAAESALWAAMRALEEKASMTRRMADAARGPEGWKKRLREQAESVAAHAGVIRKMIIGEPVEVRAAKAPESPPEALDQDKAG